MVLSKRQRRVLAALHDLGGSGTTRDIATRASINEPTARQYLNTMQDHVVSSTLRGGDTTWKIKEV